MQVSWRNLKRNSCWNHSRKSCENSLHMKIPEKIIWNPNESLKVFLVVSLEIREVNSQEVREQKYILKLFSEESLIKFLLNFWIIDFKHISWRHRLSCGAESLVKQPGYDFSTNLANLFVLLTTCGWAKSATNDLWRRAGDRRINHELGALYGELSGQCRKDIVHFVIMWIFQECRESTQQSLCSLEIWIAQDNVDHSGQGWMTRSRVFWRVLV